MTQSVRTFHRKTGQRRLFKQGLAHNLIMRGKMETTTPRAKEIRPIVERYVTIGKKNTTAAYRMLLAKLPKVSAEKVFYDIAPKYKERKGGYLRITKMSGARKRDGAETSVIEFV